VLWWKKSNLGRGIVSFELRDQLVPHEALVALSRCMHPSQLQIGLSTATQNPSWPGHIMRRPFNSATLGMSEIVKSPTATTDLSELAEHGSATRKLERLRH
jgi:hypothetical protein